MQGWFTDDTPKRFEAYGWHVIPHVDGHDVAAVDAAIKAAQAVTDRPSLLLLQDDHRQGCAHQGRHRGTCTARRWATRKSRARAPRSAGRIRRSRFPTPIYAAWSARECGALLEADWNAKFAAYRAAFPELAAEFTRRMAGDLPAGVRTPRRCAFVAAQAAKAETVATRKASQQAIEAFAPLLPEMLGGSADLTGSVFTNWSGSTLGRAGDKPGNYVNFGVREFGMSAIANGLALHGGFIPYAGTFLTFSDYARNALRMAALMKLRSIFVYTHDSIGLGEDGPTHQSVEHAASLRLIPGMDVWRPCDTVETAVAWTAAIERRHGPIVPAVHAAERAVRAARRRSRWRPSAAAATCWPISARGSAGKVVLIATGSEVALAMTARDALAKEGIAVRVVSMPCTSVFDRAGRRLSRVRAAARRRRASRSRPASPTSGASTSAPPTIRRRGDRHRHASANPRPAGVLFKHFGFTVENVVAKVRQTLGAKPAP